MRVVPMLALLVLTALWVACRDEPRRAEDHAAQPAETSPSAGAIAAVPPQAGATSPSPPSWGLPGAPDPRPRRVSITPGSMAVATHGVYLIDPHTGQIDGWISDPTPTAIASYPLPHTISPGGRYIVLVQRGPGPDRWYLFDTRRNQIQDLPSEPGPFSPDESRYVERTSGGLVRSEDGGVEQVFNLGELYGSSFAFWRLWSPGGDTLIVPVRVGWVGVDPRFRTYRLDARSGAVRDLGDGYLYAAWYPDGRRYALLSSRGDHLAVFDAATDTPLWSVTPDALNRDGRFATGSVGFDTPAIAGDGGAISVYVTGQDPTSGEPLRLLSVLDAETGAPRFYVEGADCENQWTSDGRWLLVGGLKNGLYTGYLVTRDGSQLRPFPRITHVRLSPVDPALAVQTAPPFGPPRLSVLDLPDGVERLAVELTAPPGVPMGTSYRWLADGRLAAVVAEPLQGHCHILTRTPAVTIRFP